MIQLRSCDKSDLPSGRLQNTGDEEKHLNNVS